MVMDSTQAAQDSLDEVLAAAGQEDDGSGTDAATATRINGLMRLVGKRTTEANQQKARAERAEAALAEARQQLATYESGADLSEDDAADASAAAGLLHDQDGADGDAGADRAGDDDTDSGAGWWMPGIFHAPNFGDPAAYVDPNSASRASSLVASTPTETQHLRSEFDRSLDQALAGWGVETTGS
jgi:hypothetical protein